MKKTISFILSILLIALSCGCAQESDANVSQSSEQFGVSLETFQEEPIVLPSPSTKKPIKSPPLEALPKETDCIFIFDKAGGHFWGSKQTQGDEWIESQETIFQQSPYTEITLQYPKDHPKWHVGSGKFAIMQNRYIYQWLGYSSEHGYDVEHDVRLTCTDIQTGEVSLVEKRRLNTPLIYLHVIDDTHFLSYYITKAASDKTEYATLAVAEVYNVDGTKTEIVREKYENNVSWSNSLGTLIERFTVSDGEIYGFGRRLINGKYSFFLYHYSLTGELLNTQSMPDIENVIRDEQPLEFYIVNDYIIVRTYETLTTYICKKKDDGLIYIAKGNRLYYDILEQDGDKYIFLMEQNVNDDDTIKDKDCPLYIINTKNDKTVCFSIDTSIEKPYFTDMELMIDGDLILSFCESVYNPLQNKKIILTNEKLQQLLP